MKLFTFRRQWLFAIGLLFAFSANAQEVTFTCVNGSNFEDGEGCAAAFDHDLSTKWGQYSTGDYYAVVEASEPVYMTGYAIVNAGDNYEYYRDLGEWEIFGTNDESLVYGNDYTPGADGTPGWTKFEDVLSNEIVKQVNYTAFYFSMNPYTTPFKYFLFKRVGIYEGYTGDEGYYYGSQMSEIVFSYNTEQPFHEGISYTVVEANPEGGSSEAGHYVFDELWDTKWCGNANGSDEYVWTLTFTTSEAIAPTGYYFVTGNDSPWRDPQAWTLYGSLDDGATWDVLDQVEEGNLPEVRRAYAHFSMTAPAEAYDYYKLEITDNRSDAYEKGEPSLMQMGEFALTTQEKDINTNTHPVVYSGANRMSDAENEAKIFDGNYSSKWCEGYTSGTDKSSVVFGVGYPISLYGYGMHGAYEWGATDRAPKTWVLEGTNTYYEDSESYYLGYVWDDWETIQEVTDDTYQYDPNSTSRLKYYVFDEPTKEYAYYRITITENNGSIDVMQLGELIPLFNRGGQMDWLEIADGTDPAVINGVVTVADLNYSRDDYDPSGTLSVPFALTSDDTTQYYILNNLDEDGVHFSKVDAVEAYTPVMYTTEAETLAIQTTAALYPQTAAVAEAEGVTMIGVNSVASVSFDDDFLATNQGVPYGYDVNSETYVALGEEDTCSAYRAYLLLDSATTDALAVVFDDANDEEPGPDEPEPEPDPEPGNPDGIQDIQLDEAGQAYNILGVPVNDSYKGIVIKNGKKVLNK